ncbi:hypothetical protein MRX96_010977 [Rhipicephalus microplus]
MRHTLVSMVGRAELLALEFALIKGQRRKIALSRIVIAARRYSQESQITSVMLERIHDTTSQIFNWYPEFPQVQDDENNSWNHC